MNRGTIINLRMICLDCNLPNLNMTIKAYQQEIDNRPFETAELEQEMYNVCRRYSQQDLSHIPPHLPRKLDETPEQHLTRLYDAHIPTIKE